MKVDIKNLKEFLNILNTLPDATDKSIYEALEITMGEIEKRAKMYVPVDTGYLRSDIKTRVGKKQLQGVIWNTAHYAVHVHETHRTKSHYLLRAILNNQKALAERIIQRMELMYKRGLTPRR